MSFPILRCRYRKALEDKESFDSLASDMAYNMKVGHWTTLPCRCNPPCAPLTKNECEIIGDLLTKKINEINNETHEGSNKCG